MSFPGTTKGCPMCGQSFATDHEIAMHFVQRHSEQFAQLSSQSHQNSSNPNVGLSSSPPNTTANVTAASSTCQPPQPSPVAIPSVALQPSVAPAKPQQDMGTAQQPVIKTPTDDEHKLASFAFSLISQFSMYPPNLQPAGLSKLINESQDQDRKVSELAKENMSALIAHVPQNFFITKRKPYTDKLSEAQLKEIDEINEANQKNKAKKNKGHIFYYAKHQVLPQFMPDLNDEKVWDYVGTVDDLGSRLNDVIQQKADAALLQLVMGMSGPHQREISTIKDVKRFCELDYNFCERVLGFYDFDLYTDNIRAQYQRHQLETHLRQLCQIEYNDPDNGNVSAIHVHIVNKMQTHKKVYNTLKKKALANANRLSGPSVATITHTTNQHQPGMRHPMPMSNLVTATMNHHSDIQQTIPAPQPTTASTTHHRTTGQAPPSAFNPLDNHGPLPPRLLEGPQPNFPSGTSFLTSVQDSFTPGLPLRTITPPFTLPIQDHHSIFPASTQVPICSANASQIAQKCHPRSLPAKASHPEITNHDNDDDDNDDDSVFDGGLSLSKNNSNEIPIRKRKNNSVEQSGTTNTTPSIPSEEDGIAPVPQTNQHFEIQLQAFQEIEASRMAGQVSVSPSEQQKHSSTNKKAKSDHSDDPPSEQQQSNTKKAKQRKPTNTKAKKASASTKKSTPKASTSTKKSTPKASTSTKKTKGKKKDGSTDSQPKEECKHGCLRCGVSLTGLQLVEKHWLKHYINPNGKGQYKASKLLPLSKCAGKCGMEASQLKDDFYYCKSCEALLSDLPEEKLEGETFFWLCKKCHGDRTKQSKSNESTDKGHGIRSSGRRPKPKNRDYAAED